MNARSRFRTSTFAVSSYTIEQVEKLKAWNLETIAPGRGRGRVDEGTDS